MSIPKKTIRDMVYRNGAERIQDGAVELLIKYLESQVREATTHALNWMEYAGRVTLFKKDMEKAINQLKKR